MTPERFGSYEVYELLGKGGMATVHRAERINKDGSRTQVALKRLLPAIAANRHLVQAFETEARLLRYLDHSNIAQTYDHGKAIGGSYFIAMEYVPGPTLKELVRHAGATVGNIANGIALNIAAQVCDALDHAHTRCDHEDKPLGIIHRDICPANIILSNQGSVKLIDFGLAKARLRRTHDTDRGVIKGKFNYVAPEYLRGDLDARADLWALGVVLYELLTSRRLFDGPDNHETMARVRKLPIPPPSRANPRVSPELDHIVMTALQRDPVWRWQTAAEMREALRHVIEQPGNFVDNRHVAEWVVWVLAQRPGTQESGLSELRRITGPNPIVVPPPDPPRQPKLAETVARSARRLLGRKPK